MADVVIPSPFPKAIPLTHGRVAIVDESDYAFLMQWKWHVTERGYAVRTIRIDGKSSPLSMHRLILGTPKGMMSDHINGDRLDNRRSNLRICTAAENARNLGPRRIARSQYKGVTWHKKSQKWQARIKSANKTIHLGLYTNEIDAAKAYNDAAPKYFANFCRLNPIPINWEITTKNIDKSLNNVTMAKRSSSSTSQYKGVSKQGKKWRAAIKTDSRLRYLGAFESEELAAMAYNTAASEAWGTLAWLNPVPNTLSIEGGK